MKISKFSKNLLCLFTAMAMIMSMMPVAFATTPETEEISSEEITEVPSEEIFVEEDSSSIVVNDDNEELQDLVIGNDTEYVEVTSADGLEEALINGGAICLADNFEIDRTFYVTADTYIYSDVAITLTRATDFGGDVFVVGEDADGNVYEGINFTFGNIDSQEENLITIDGNKDNTVDITGTVLFVANNACAELYGVNIINCYKNGNERTLDEKYNLSYAEQIGGAAVILASGTLNIYGGNYSNNSVHDVEGEESARGGVIYSLGNLNIYGGSFEENHAARGGAIYNYNETHIYNATFTQNSATYRGGAIYSPNTSLAKLFLGEENDVCENTVVFDSNTSVERGGAIFGYGTINVNNSQFTNNTSTQSHGGAIVADGRIEGIAKTLVVANSLFENNSSYFNGGAVYLTGTDASFNNVEFSINTAYANANSSGTRYGGGAVYSTGSNSEFSTVTFTDNHSDYAAGAMAFYSQSVAKVSGVTATSNSAELHGGAIYINNSEIEINEAYLNGNSSSGHGGAVYATNSKATVNGSEFTGNTAATNGGAVYETGAEFVIDDTDFTSNTATGNGGAVYTTNSSSKITNSDFAENEADKGGAVYFHTTSTADFSNVSFTENKSTTDAGAVRVDGGSSVVMNKITAERNSSNQAGFLYNNASVLNLYNSTVNENEAITYNAGAIYSGAGASSNIYKTKFSKNSAPGNGGALYMYTDTAESIIHSCTFSENTSGKYGGVMYASNKSIVKMYNTVATDNEAGNGGFLYQTTTGTTITMAGLTVSGNTATVGGPTIWGNSNGAVLNIDKEKYFDIDNTGELDDSYWAEAIVNNLTVNNLSVDIPGYQDYEGEEGDTPSEPEEKVTVNIKSSSQLEQAIGTGFTSFRIVADFELDRTFYITEDTYIFSDEAHTLTRKADFAGDIFVVGESADGTFTENPVTLTFGNPESDSENLLVVDGNKDNLSVSVTGTVFFIGNNSTVNLHKNVTVKNNKKLGNERTLDGKYGVSYPNDIGGAAAIIASGTLNVYGSTFSNNTVHNVEGEASARGGAIYSFGNLNIYGATISENSAARGGAIYSYKKTNIYNASITKNHASYRGGAIYMPASVNSRLNLGGANDIIEANVLFEENSAKDNGGAIFDQGVLNANNTTFLKNTSDNHGGAIAAYGIETLGDNKTMTLKDTVFTENTAAGNGGAVYLSSGSDSYLHDVTFTGNEAPSASSGGGAIYSTGSTFEINGATFTKNSTAKHGGAILVNTSSTAVMNNITATENTAAGSGGFIHNNVSAFTLYNSVLTDNEAASNGGAVSVYVASDATGISSANIYNTDFERNVATLDGGGLYAYSNTGEIIVHSCDFTSNVSARNGGAIYASNKSILKAYNTTATDNNADKGGFIYETTTGTVATISGLTVSGNTAASGGPIIWGNSTGAALKINKNNYTDLAHTGEYDSTYWSSAIVNKLTVEETADEVPRYQDYKNELYDEFDDVTDVTSAEELEIAINGGAKNIRIVESFEIDRTFYVTDEVVIFTTASKTLTRKADFAGDIFIVGEDALGNSSISLGKTAKLTLGNQYSESEDFLIIDGNSENMTVDVTGTVLFLEESSQIDIYKNVTIENNRKVGNERILKEKYLVNNANRVGGAAMIISDGTVNIYGAKFKNNVVNEEPTGEGVTEEDRRSYLGGAIYNRGTVNIHSGLFEGNQAARGGGMYNLRALKIYSGQFIGNRATTNGGAIYLAGTQFSQMYAGDQLNSNVSEKILFKDNTSVSNGGALYCSSMAIAMIYGDTIFDGNSTESNGGAIATYGTVYTNNVVMKNNYAYNLGGAAYIANSSDDLVTRIVTFENTAFENNTAKNGGAIAVYASNSQLEEGGIVEVKNCDFTGNKAVNTSDNEVTSNVFGGAIYITRKSTLDIEESSFTANEALFEGGAIYSAGESDTVIKNSTFKNNTTTSNTTDKGGAVSVHSANLDFDTVTFEGNSTTTNGGAIYVSYTTASTVNSDVNIKDSNFVKNVAGKNGGALYVTKHTVETKEDEIVNIKNTTFDENTAVLGGAAYLTSFSDTYMKDVVFKNNTASSTESNSYGGAIYLTNSAVAEIDGGQFTENSSTYCSGGISIHSSARAILNNITATNNSAPTSAGFLYVNSARLDMYSSEIKESSAGVNGGAIAMYNSAVANLNNIVFDSNTAGGYGGAIYNTTSEAESVFHTCTFKNNTTPKFGGAMFVNNKAILKLYNTTAENNSAQKGGVLYETTTDTEVTVNGMTVKGNTATEEGPVIFGNTIKAILNIHKMNFTDEDRGDTADDDYWYYAIANELTVNDLSGIEDEIPECDTYVSKESDEEVEKERVPVPVTDVLSLGQNSSNASINYSYGKLPELDKSSNFMSRSTTVFPNINGQDVTVDTFVSHENDPANNCTVGEGILLYQAILYKEAHPEEEVNISIAAFRFSALAAVCINRDSRYFGYMRNLPDADYDKYGFVRLSYLLVTAAKMGVNVTVVGQLDGYPQPSSAPTLYEYFTHYLDEPCDPTYAEGKFVKDYMTFGYCEWTSYDNKAATDMMHTKMCAVSHYLDMDGNVQRNAVWSSSSNLDGINSDATNGNDKMQTATIVSNHEEIYRTAYNYINILPEYCGQEEVYNFRTLVADMSKKQIGLIEAGRADEIAPDEQIVYLGTENDDVFELYFSPFGGDVLAWTESYNPYCKFVRKFSNSDDYVMMIWNSANYDKSTSIVLQLEDMLTNTFLTKKNPNNKIYINLEDFNTDPYKNLVVGQDIGLKSFNMYDLGKLHSKDLQLSYSENGKREYVSILSSINMHGGAMSYQSNYVLVIKEDNCNEDSVFFNIADQTSVGVVEHTYGEEKQYIPETAEDGYTYKECVHCSKTIIIGTLHRPGEWTVAKDATVTTNGIEYRHCTGCGMLVETRETVGKEEAVQYEGVTFSKDLSSRVPVKLSTMPKTFEATIQLSKKVTARAGVIISNYEISRNNSISIEIVTNGKLRLYYRNDGVIGDYTFKTDVRSDVPKHIALTVDGLKATLYVDGIAVETKTLARSLPEIYDNMYIGGDDRAGNNQYFRGKIYSAAIFSDIRSVEEIKNDSIILPTEDENLLYSRILSLPEEVKVEESYTVVNAKAETFTANDTPVIGNLAKTPKTFEATVKVPLNMTERGGVIVSNYDGGTEAQIAIEIYSSGRPRLYAYTPSGRIDCVFTTDIRSDVPRHLAISVEGKKATLYLDSVAVETKTIKYELPDATENFKIGGDDRSENSQYFKGEIYSVALFDDARTPEEIKKDARLVTSDEEGILYAGYFTQEYGTTVLKEISGRTFDKKDIKGIYDLSAAPYTYEAVVNVPASIEDRAGVIVGNYKAGEKDVVSFEIYSGGRPRLYYSNNGIVGDYVFNTDIRTGKSRYVVITVGTDTTTLYVDGVKVEELPLTVPYPDVTDDLKLGGDNRSGNGQYFKGRIYSAAMYSYEKTAEEVEKTTVYDSQGALYSAYYTKANDNIVVKGEGKTFSANKSTSIPLNLGSVPYTFEATVAVPFDNEDRAGIIVGNYKLGALKVLSFEISSGGRPRLYYKTGEKNVSVDCTFDADIRTGKPVHIAISVEGLEATLYINGVRTQTKTLKKPLPDEAKDLRIGGDNRSGNLKYFRGTIYDVALFADARSDEEIASDVKGIPDDADAMLYNTDFTAEICTASTTGGKHKESDWIIDNEPGEGITGLKHKECTLCGIMLTTREYTQTEETGNTMDYTDSNAGKTFATAEDVFSIDKTFDQTPKTYEATFILPKSYDKRAGVILGNYDGGTSDQINIEIYTEGKPRLYYKRAGRAYTYLFNTDVRSDSVTHLAITIDGNTAHLYLNGELKESVTISGTFANVTSGIKVGGDNRTTGAQYFKGTLYSVNLFADVRSAEEIKYDSIMVTKDSQDLVFSHFFK